MLDERRSTVLETLIEEYITTGEPVSSATVLHKSGLGVSSATVRNDLAKLEDLGLVAQPHTSAGRIPTDAGYRYYVDHCAPARLRRATLSRIESFFADVHDELGRLLKETSDLLADLTTYPAVVLGPGIVGERLRGIHLVRLAERAVLVVAITSTGRVFQEVAKPPYQLSAEQIDEAEALLVSHFIDHTIAEGIDSLDHGMGSELPRPVRGLLRAVMTSLEMAQTGTREVYMGGTSYLTSLWGDLAHVHSVLALLDRESSLLEILQGVGPGTTVRIGAELPVDSDDPEVDLAVVSARYAAGERGAGRVGVLGPTRMDYRRTIKVLEEVSENLGDRLGG